MAGYDRADIQGEVEEMLVECIGDDQFMEDEDYADLDLFEEYNLDVYNHVEIVKALNDRFDLGISPTQVEPDDISTVNKIVWFVEDCLAE